MKVAYRDVLTFDYGFQLGNEDLDSVRHEIDNTINLYPVTLTTRYLYAKQIEGVTDDREQIQSYAMYNFTPEWRAIACAASCPITTASSSSDFAMRSMPV